MKKCILHRLPTILLVLLMLCISCMTSAQADASATLYLAVSSSSGYAGDEITLSVILSAEGMGGLQTKIVWNTGNLTYVEGSASFGSAFVQDAEIGQFNAQDGCISLVYGNTGGYTAREETVFTARFRLSEGTTGWTNFDLANTKMSDASTAIKPMEVSSWGASVETAPSYAGDVWLNLNLRDHNQQYPAVGDKVELSLGLSSSGPAVGSVQGVISYDPAVLSLVRADFTAEAESAAFTKSLNTSAIGRISFVYAALDGCPQSELLLLTFEVIGAGNGCTYLDVGSVKATNNKVGQLASMNCWPSGLSLYPQGNAGRVSYTLTLADAVKCSDSEIAVCLGASGSTIGGVQATLTYDPAQMEYVNGSAAFLDDFAQRADVKMINDGVAGQIQLLYANSDGYQPDGSSIFTARFRLLSMVENITPVLMTDIKTTNADQDNVQILDSSFSNGIDWRHALHTPATDAPVAPGCTASGLTVGKHCAVCNAVLAAQTIIPAKGHLWDEGTITKEPSTTEEGVKTFACTVCLETRTESIPVVEIVRFPGDADENGRVDILDALVTLQYAVGWDLMINTANANVDGNSSVNILDALLILQYAVGWDVKLQ